jgi:hypothetical protein
MKLKELAKKPVLTKVTISDKDIVEKYGEEIEFHVYDRYEFDTYLKLFQTEENDMNRMTEIVKELLMDENGKPIITDGEILPSDIMVKAIEEVVQILGNSVTPTSST